MNNERIEIDDIVTVGFYDGGQIIKAKVLYVPCATGDSWIMKDAKERIYYVQQFETMLLVEKGVPK
jgi:hypothetical protein